MLTVKVDIGTEFYEHSRNGKKAAYLAINRSVDGMVTNISRELRAIYNVPKQEIDKRLRKIKAPSADSLSGQVTVLNKDEVRSALPLVLYGAKGRMLGTGSNIKTSFTKKGAQKQTELKKDVMGVSFTVLQAGGKGYSSNAVIMAGGGGSVQVVRFIKGAPKDKRIKELRTLSITSMLRKRADILVRVEQQARDTFTKYYKDTLAYLETRAGKGQG